MLNGSILISSSNTVTYTYDVGNSNFNNPTFTLKFTGTLEPGLFSAVAEDLSESDFGSGSTVNLKGVFTVPEGDENYFGWGFVAFCDGEVMNSYMDFPIGENNGKVITRPTTLVPGLTYTYQTSVLIKQENGYSTVTKSEPVSFTMPGDDGTIPVIEANLEFELGTEMTLYKFKAAEAGAYIISSSGNGGLMVYSQNGDRLGVVYPEAPSMSLPAVAKGDTLWLIGLSLDPSSPMKFVLSLQSVIPSDAETEAPEEDPTEEESDAGGEEDPAGEIPVEEPTENPSEENPPEEPEIPTEENPPEQPPETRVEAENEEEPSESVSTEQPAEDPSGEENSEADLPAPPEVIPPEQTADEDHETAEPASQPSLPIE